MIFRRRLQPSERQEADLSPDGSTILAVTGRKKNQGAGPTVVLDSGMWKLRDARSGRVLKTLKAPKNASHPYLIGKGLFAYHSDGISSYRRLSDGKTLWTRGIDRFGNGGKPLTKLWVWNNETGRDRVFAAPEEKKWRDLAISPDRKTLYGVTFEGEIYRCAAREMEP